MSLPLNSKKTVALNEKTLNDHIAQCIDQSYNKKQREPQTCFMLKAFLIPSSVDPVKLFSNNSFIFSILLLQAVSSYE